MAPKDFWRLSVREWRALTASDVAPLGRTEMEALMARWPDAVVLTREAGEGDRA